RRPPPRASPSRAPTPAKSRSARTTSSPTSFTTSCAGPGVGSRGSLDPGQGSGHRLGGTGRPGRRRATQEVQMSSNGSPSWRMVGDEVGNCNCDWGCPCQFDALPTHGNCMAMIAYEINQGSFGDTRLDGARLAGLG